MKLLEFLSRFHPPGKIIFAKIWGSHSHNTQKESSDTDFAGVYLCPTSQIVSLNPPEVTFTRDAESGVNKEESPDYQFHEVGRFCQLLLKGNPGILEMLFTERMCVTTPEWDALRAIRDRFLSQQAVCQYLGYVNGQLKRLIAHDGQRGLHTTGGDFNEKWAYHILRLAGDAKRIASGGAPVVWKEGSEREFLMQVRSMKISWHQCRNLIDKSLQEIVALSPYRIPEQGDKCALNAWLLELRKNNWN